MIAFTAILASDRLNRPFESSAKNGRLPFLRRAVVSASSDLYFFPYKGVITECKDCNLRPLRESPLFYLANASKKAIAPSLSSFDHESVCSSLTVARKHKTFIKLNL